jgi:hypothetical protein
MSIGILEMMGDGNRVTYQPGVLTMHDIEQAVKALEPRRPRQTILYVNSYGYELFNLALVMQQVFPTIKFWTYIPRRVPNFIYISLFQKHGLFKLKLHTDGRRLKYELINGTTLIGKSDSIESIRHFLKLNEQQNG